MDAGGMQPGTEVMLVEFVALGGVPYLSVRWKHLVSISAGEASERQEELAGSSRRVE